MVIASGTATSEAAVDSQAHVDLPDLRLFVFALFFTFGGITSLNDVIIPKLKELFTLNYFQALLVQSAFFAAYFLFSLPAAAIVGRFGYMRTAALGLVTMTLGCLLFVPASSLGVFGLFLLALFVLAAGITMVQVVANPLISLLGPPRTAPSRLTFAQAFNCSARRYFPMSARSSFWAVWRISALVPFRAPISIATGSGKPRSWCRPISVWQQRSPSSLESSGSIATG